MPVDDLEPDEPQGQTKKGSGPAGKWPNVLKQRVTVVGIFIAVAVLAYIISQ